MKDSEVLRRAKCIIAAGGEDFICTALSSVEGIRRGQQRRLEQWISSLLGSKYTYDSWLRNNPDFYWSGSFLDARPGRLAWLDWMIATLESEGK